VNKADEIRIELESLDASDEQLEALREKEVELAERLREQAARLSAARRQAATALEQAVTERMQALGMPGGSFSVALTATGEEPPGPLGAEQVEFQVAANPGQAGGPLARVASGGELARISLALQVAARRSEGLASLVFDEVDSGVGGGIAEIVGTQLRELSDSRQVLCVTHLAQVASQADHHLRIVKVSDGETTRTAVKPLTRNERVEEIARMLGGVEITGATREHAREMLDSGAGRRAV
jgi:DNA repair protein RecN (Recombination protein N)